MFAVIYQSYLKSGTELARSDDNCCMGRPQGPPLQSDFGYFLDLRYAACLFFS